MNNRKNLSMLVALFLILMTASSVVSGDGTDPLDPSEGGADWDGDGLTNAEEQSHGTDTVSYTHLTLPTTPYV